MAAAVIDELDPAALFDRLVAARGLLLAVSGGPDSTALMHLIARWRPSGLPVRVASVDHGLREGSHTVAESVVAEAARLGLEGRVLSWPGPKPERALQAQARAARYRLLARFAGEVGASHLVLAHTRDDQAETVLMRLAAGSGLRGLCGMRVDTAGSDVILVRPFLDVEKQTLVGLCDRENWPFVADPANADPRFARARWRRLGPGLVAEGLTAKRLHRFAQRAARANAALDAAASRARQEAERFQAGPDRCFDAAVLLGHPDEIVLRVLEDTLSSLTPAVPLRLDRLEACLAALRRAPDDPVRWRRSLKGCVLAREGHLLWLRREAPRQRGRSNLP